MSEIFGRVYRLEIGDQNEVLEVDGFGENPAQIRFRVGNNITAYQAIAEITLLCLGRDSRRDIYERYQTVRLIAGYRNRHAPIFNGTIYNVAIGQDGPESFVTLYCRAAGNEWESAFLNQSFGANTSQREIIRAAADRMGLPVDFLGDFDALPKALGGRTISQDVKSLLRDMGRNFGFSWNVEHGRLLVVRDNAARDQEGSIHRISAATGMIGSPQIRERGLDVRMTMNPNVRQYDTIEVENATGELVLSSPTAPLTYRGTIGTGRYTAWGVVHAGDFHGDEWSTTIEGFDPRVPV